MILMAALFCLLAAGFLLLDRHVAMRRSAIARRLAAPHEEAPSVSAEARLARLLPLGFAGLGIARRHVVMGAIALVFAAGFALQHGGLPGLAGLLALTAVALWRLLRFLRRRQIGAFLDGLPGFIDRLRQLVIAGNSPPTAFGKCLAHASLVEYRVFGPAAAVMAHGASLSDALQSRAEKLGIAELFLLAAIFRAHARYGGDLSAILGHFEENLLNRLRAMREFAALTAEVDMTSNILLGLPIFALFGIFSVKADYFRFFLDTPGGRMALLYVVLSLFCGFLIVRRMTHISY